MYIEYSYIGVVENEIMEFVSDEEYFEYVKED